MPVGIYLRVSTEEQRERQSIITQRAFAEQYCALHQLQIYTFYTDDAVSGTVPLPLRPGGLRALEDAREHRFEQLLVYKLDRLGRDTRLTLEAVAELEKCGVRVKSMTEEFDTATASGRLMLTMLSGFAAHERDVIRERSLAGTNRVAQTGAWMGGIVPFGYRKEGEKGKGRLVISEDPIPGVEISEAEVIRQIFHRAAQERQSCFKIADYLNRIGVPCAYVRDNRMFSRGKRTARTSGWWRAARVRNLLKNTTYMGRHEYGKRSQDPKRELIQRQVPAIVSEEIWRQAQATLASNQLISARNAKHSYLLRSLIKCGLCGLTYVGLANTRPNGKKEHYYRCNGKQGARILYGSMAPRCRSKDVNGDFLEQVVWSDVEEFLRHPGTVIDQLQQQFAAEQQNGQHIQEHVYRLEKSLLAKSMERDRMLELYRKGLLAEKDLMRQLEQIEKEQTTLQAHLDEVTEKLRGIADGATQLQTAQGILERLRSRLDEGITWEVKRQLVEALVGDIRVHTSEENGRRWATVVVTYRFASGVVTCTDRNSVQQQA